MVYLSLGSNLGSNLGDRETNLSAALAALPLHGFMIEARSSIYETAPQDVTDQPWFLNLCAGGTTELSPLELLTATRGIEAGLGRDRAGTVPGGPRKLDIDILFYDDQIIATPELTVPHPRLLKRRFVLEPLLEIAPALVHPETRRPLRDYLSTVLSQDVRRRTG
jgi:2-amino-4-hydroxy-6-hydroxymethyldihydropteridine diphosphokinase